MKYRKIPAITGNELIKILKKDGWIEKRRATHGVSLVKRIGERTRVTIIPTTRASLPEGTLSAIIGQKQTGIGKEGLLDLLDQYY